MMNLTIVLSCLQLAYADSGTANNFAGRVPTTWELMNQRGVLPNSPDPRSGMIRGTSAGHLRVDPQSKMVSSQSSPSHVFQDVPAQDFSAPEDFWAKDQNVCDSASHASMVYRRTDTGDKRFETALCFLFGCEYRSGDKDAPCAVRISNADDRGSSDLDQCSVCNDARDLAECCRDQNALIDEFFSVNHKALTSRRFCRILAGKCASINVPDASLVYEIHDEDPGIEVHNEDSRIEDSLEVEEGHDAYSQGECPEGNRLLDHLIFEDDKHVMKFTICWAMNCGFSSPDHKCILSSPEMTDLTQIGDISQHGVKWSDHNPCSICNAVGVHPNAEVCCSSQSNLLSFFKPNESVVRCSFTADTCMPDWKPLQQAFEDHQRQSLENKSNRHEVNEEATIEAFGGVHAVAPPDEVLSTLVPTTTSRGGEDSTTTTDGTSPAVYGSIVAASAAGGLLMAVGGVFMFRRKMTRSFSYYDESFDSGLASDYLDTVSYPPTTRLQT